MRQLFTLSNIDAWNEGMALVEEVNKLCASKGWAQATVFTRTVGRFGEVCLETEYPDLATMERVAKEWMEDPGIGKLARRIDAIATEDPGYSELWEEALRIPD
jgi:hypothetical protein